jgi:hypothetical protein
MAHENQEGPAARPLDESGPEPRTTAFSSQSCERCQRPLTGRKERFCSDRCRMAVRRQSQTARVRRLLTAIEESVAALRGELEGGRESC